MLFRRDHVKCADLGARAYQTGQKGNDTLSVQRCTENSREIVESLTLHPALHLRDVARISSAFHEMLAAALAPSS
jgi:hypothetical protein